MLALKAAGRHPGLAIEPHLARAIAPGGQLVLQRAAFELAGGDAPLPLQDLDDLPHTAMRGFPAELNRLVEKVRHHRVRGPISGAARGEQPAESLRLIPPHVAPDGPFGEAGLGTDVGFELASHRRIDLIPQERRNQLHPLRGDGFRLVTVFPGQNPPLSWLRLMVNRPRQVTNAERVWVQRAASTRRWTMRASHPGVAPIAQGARRGSTGENGRTPSVSWHGRACRASQHPMTYGIHPRNQASPRCSVDASAATAAVRPWVANVSRLSASYRL